MTHNLKKPLRLQAGPGNYEYGKIFLPISLVKVVFKIAKMFNLRSFDEFSLLDTLQCCLCNKIIQYDGHEPIDEKEICLMLANIIRVTEKYNEATSQLTKLKFDSIFPNLGITSSEFNDNEFETFKSMDFKVMRPIAVEKVYQLIDEHPVEPHKKDFLFEFSLDVLRLTYANRFSMFESFAKGSNEDIAKKVMMDQHLIASAVLMVALKILQVPDRIHNRVFDAVSAKLDIEESSVNLNQLSAIIFNLIERPE